MSNTTEINHRQERSIFVRHTPINVYQMGKVGSCTLFRNIASEVGCAVPDFCRQHSLKHEVLGDSFIIRRAL